VYTAPFDYQFSAFPNGTRFYWAAWDGWLLAAREEIALWHWLAARRAPDDGTALTLPAGSIVAAASDASRPGDVLSASLVSTETGLRLDAELAGDAGAWMEWLVG